MGYEVVKSAGNKIFSKGAGKLFSFAFLFIFLIIPIIYSVVISLEAKSIEPGVTYLGDKFLKPIVTLSEQSKIVIEQGGAYPHDGNFLKNLWGFIKQYWNLFGSLYIIYRWLWLFSKIISMSPLSNDSETFRNWFMAIITFVGLQLIYLLGTAPVDVNNWSYSMNVFNAWGDFFRAFPYLIKQANSFIDPTINTIPQLNVTNITI